MKNLYQENGYENSKDYLRCMSEEYGVPLEVVLVIADTYGLNEDFDGLINALEDAEDIERRCPDLW